MVSLPSQLALGTNLYYLGNRTPKIGEHGNSTLVGWEAWLTARYTSLPPSTCYEFSSTATKGVYINRREPPNLGCAWARSLEVGV